MWTALEKIIYQFGIIEVSGSIAISIIFFSYSFVASAYIKSRLFTILCVLSLSAIAWTVLYEGQDAYLFKAVKNGLFLVGIGAVWMSYIWFLWGARLSSLLLGFLRGK